MNYYVYVIKNSVNKKIYIGQTSNIDERLKRHNRILRNKATSYTSKNLENGIWELAYSEKLDSRNKAILREKELKSYQGRRFIKNLLSR